MDPLNGWSSAFTFPDPLNTSWLMFLCSIELVPLQNFEAHASRFVLKFGAEHSTNHIARSLNSLDFLFCEKTKISSRCKHFNSIKT